MPPRHRTHNVSEGFTLVEMAIVLVIIGLVIGAILVGRDLIQAAELQAQVSQIGKYKAAVNTFRLKYNCLPGDCQNATDYGFAARGQYAGEGDGNGIIEGVSANAAGQNGPFQGTGEAAMFWVDLSVANLMDGSFTTASASVVPGADITGASLAKYLPRAKIGNGAYVFVFASNGIANPDVAGAGNAVLLGSGVNQFGLAAVQIISESGLAKEQISSNPGFSVIQAYNIDQKIDDGMPMSGRVTANYLNFPQYICAGACPPDINPSATSCFDNNATGALPAHYTTQVNKGTGINCGLAIWFQ